MSPQLLRAALCAGPLAFAALAAANAHEIVGNRMFPATLAIDDPGVADELSLPTIAFSKTGDDPSVKQLDISGEYSKRITEDFAVSFSPTWTHIYAPGGPKMVGASGFQNIETTFKYRVFNNAEHEFVARSASTSNGAAAARKTSAPTASPPTRRRFISAKASAICRRAWVGRGLSRSPDKSATRSRVRTRRSPSIPPAATSTPNSIRAS